MLKKLQLKTQMPEIWCYTWWNYSVRINIVASKGRLVIAASCLTNTAHALADRPKSEQGQTQVIHFNSLQYR
jgi:hypothetical protein